MPWPVGGLIEGRYEVFDLKTRNLGLIYTCYDSQRRDALVIRTYPDELLASPMARRRFTENARGWQRVSDHDNILTVVEVRDVEDTPCVFIEFIEPSKAGLSLRSRLSTLTYETALDFAIQACRGLAHVYQTEPALVHGDVRPSNILVTGKGVARIADFGLLTAIVDASKINPLVMAQNEPVSGDIVVTEGGLPIGAPLYLAPERIRDAKPADELSDIYSFGCMLYEMVSGRTVFGAETVPAYLQYHVDTLPDPPGTPESPTPPAVQDIIMVCLAKNPDERPQGFAALLSLLDSAQQAPTARLAELLAPPVSAELAPAFEEPTLEEPVPEVPGPEVPTLEESLPEEPVPEEPALEEPALEAHQPLADALPEAGIPESQFPEAPAGLFESKPDEGRQRAASLVEEGLRLARAGNLDAAIERWQQALDFCWEYAAAHSNIGAALAAKGELGRAREHFEHAARLDPERPQTYFNLGRLHHELGRHEDAAHAFRTALRLDPEYAVAYRALGAVYEYQGKLDLAAEMYESAVRYGD